MVLRQADREKDLNGSKSCEISVLSPQPYKREPVDYEELSSLFEKCIEEGNYSLARKYAEIFLSMSLEEFGEKHLNTVSAFIKAGRITLLSRDLKKSKEFFKKALAIQEEILGKDSPVLVPVLSYLGEIEKIEGNYALAEEFYFRAISTSRISRGEMSEEVARESVKLAELYMVSGKLEKALEFYESALNIYLKVSGKNHPAVSLVLAGKGLVEKIRGNMAEAEKYFLEAVEINEKTIPEHPQTAAALENLAELYRIKKRFKKAEPLYLKALSIWKTMDGGKGLDSSLTMNNIGLLYKDWKRPHEATAFLEKALMIQRNYFGDEHPVVARTLSNLALVQIDLGNYDRAIEFLKRSSELFEKVKGAKDPERIATLEELVKLLLRTGRKDEARITKKLLHSLKSKEAGDRVIGR